MRLVNGLWLTVSILSVCATARGDVVVHDLGAAAANTLRSLGTAFVTGCVVIGIAAVVVAAISRGRKG